VIAEAMKWVLVYLAIGNDRCYWTHIFLWSSLEHRKENT
jgi:hypothetical protein